MELEPTSTLANGDSDDFSGASLIIKRLVLKIEECLFTGFDCGTLRHRMPA